MDPLKALKAALTDAWLDDKISDAEFEAIYDILHNRKQA